jgi:hypothetical protein
MSSESKVSKDRDRAIQWLRDEYDKEPPVDLFQTIHDVVWVEILTDTTTNACETTPHLRDALLTLCRMQEPNKRKANGMFWKAINLLGVYEFRMSKKKQ